MIEEEGSPKPATLLERRVLDSWGVAEIEAYIAALRAEISRAEAAIASKSRHRGAADALFGGRPGG